MKAKELFNSDNGKGIIQRATDQDKEYRRGKDNEKNLNTCHNLVMRILKELNISVQGDAIQLFRKFDEYSAKYEDTVTKPIFFVNKWMPTGKGRIKDPKIVKRYNVKTGACTNGKYKSAGTSDLTPPKDDSEPGQNQLAGGEDEAKFTANKLDISSTDDFTDKPVPKVLLSPRVKGQELVW